MSSFESAAAASPRSLDDYIKFAQRHNPEVRTAFYRFQSLAEQSSVEGAWPEPQLSFGYFVENVETRVGPQQSKLSFRQMIPWLGKPGAKGSVVSKSAEAAFEKFQAARLKIRYDVTGAYLDFYYLKKEIAVTGDNLDLLKYWQTVLESRYRTSQSDYSDLVKIQVETFTLENRLESLQAQMAPSETRLRQAINLDDTTQLKIADKVEINEAKPKSDSLYYLALQNNPDLKRIEKLIEREDEGIKLASKMNRPDFSVGFDYIFVGDALNPAMAESGKDAWAINAGISLPIWFGKNSARKKSAVAKKKAAEYERERYTDQLRSVIDELIFKYNDAQRESKLYQQALLPKAEEALNVVYKSYQSGNSSILDLIDSQRRLIDFQLNSERATVNSALTRAKIEQVIGMELK